MVRKSLRNRDAAVKVPFHFTIDPLDGAEFAARRERLDNLLRRVRERLRIRTQEAHRGDELEIWKNNPIRRDSHRPSRSIVARLHLSGVAQRWNTGAVK